MKVLRSNSQVKRKYSKLSHKKQQKSPSQERIKRCSKRSKTSSPSPKISQIKTRASTLKNKQRRRQTQPLTAKSSAKQKKTTIPLKGKKISKRRNSTNKERNLKLNQRSDSTGYGRVYKQFSRQKYNKYRAQFPKLRQSEIVTKIIKEWDRMQKSKKQKLKQIYVQKNFLNEYQIDSSQALKGAERTTKEARLEAQISAKAAMQRIQKPYQPTYLHCNIRQTRNQQDCSDYNRHSQRQESEIQKNQGYKRFQQIVQLKKTKTRVVKKKKQKKIQKKPQRSEKIKNSVIFQKRWQYYRAYYYSNARPKWQKKVEFKKKLQQKLKHRSKSQKLQVMRRVVAKSLQRQRKPRISLKVVHNKKITRFQEVKKPKITELTPNSPYLLCHQCNELINEDRSQACRKCGLVYHKECSKVVRQKRYCFGCCYDTELDQRYITLPANLKTSKQKNPWLVNSPKFVGEKLRMIKKCQEENQRILKQRLNCSYSFYNRYSFHFTNSIIPSVNPTFPQLGYKDIQIVQSFADSKAFPPIQIKKHDKIDGYGVFAYRDIRKHQLIDSYSGAVLTQAFIEKNRITPEYVMALCEGISLHTTWSICPFKFSSFGPMLNCALKKKDINVETLMCVTNEQFLILMRSKRAIKKGQELLYQYNGRLSQYDISGFNEI